MVRAVGVAKRLGVRRRVLGHVALRVGVREDVILAAAVDVERAALTRPGRGAAARGPDARTR